MMYQRMRYERTESLPGSQRLNDHQWVANPTHRSTPTKYVAIRSGLRLVPLLERCLLAGVLRGWIGAILQQ